MQQRIKLPPVRVSPESSKAVSSTCPPNPILTIKEVQDIFLAGLRGVVPSTARYDDKQLTAKVGKNQLEDTANFVVDYLERSCEDIGSKNAYVALTSRCLQCLSDYLFKIGVPVTITTIFQNVHLINHAVDSAFPGYASSRFLKTIISPSSAFSKSDLQAA